MEYSAFISPVIITLAVFVLALAVLLVYYFGVFSHLAFYKPYRKRTSEAEPVSVVICARNEYLNLKDNLRYVLEQEYPDYEVVVVNDGSDDLSKDFLIDMRLKYTHLKVIELPDNSNFFKGKKFPMSMGIRSASHDLILLTDADCRPANPLWIRNMQSFAVPGAEVVLGYGAYLRQSGLLNLLIRFDTLHIAIQYLSFGIFGRPYMGVGRNLMYRKSLFLRNKGFSEHYTVASGDDDLFINKAAGWNNTRVAAVPEAITYSAPKKNFTAWQNQKRRHLSTAKYYRPGDKVLLGLYPMAQGLFCISFVILLTEGTFLLPVLALALVRTLLQYVIFGLASRRTGEGKLFLLSLVLEPLMLSLNSLFLVTNWFKRKHIWK